MVSRRFRDELRLGEFDLTAQVYDGDVLLLSSACFHTHRSLLASCVSLTVPNDAILANDDGFVCDGYGCLGSR